MCINGHLPCPRFLCLKRLLEVVLSNKVWSRPPLPLSVAGRGNQQQLTLKGTDDLKAGGFFWVLKKTTDLTTTRIVPFLLLQLPQQASYKMLMKLMEWTSCCVRQLLCLIRKLLYQKIIKYKENST